MILTGLAHAPSGLFESSPTPSIELISFARLILEGYPGAHLLTGLEPGWDYALAKAAVELEIPFIVVLPYQMPDVCSSTDQGETKRLLSLATEIETVDRLVEDICAWRISRSDQVLALWNRDFCGKTFQRIALSVKLDKPVCNLWHEWETWVHLRRDRPVSATQAWRGARVFSKS